MSCGQPVDADHLGGGPAGDGEDAGLGDALGQRLLQLGGGDGLALQVALGEVVVGHHDALDQVVAHLVLALGHVVGDLALGGLAPLVEHGAVGEQVGDAPEARLLADGQLEGRHAGPELVAELVEGAVEAGPLPVELVDEEHAGQAPLGGQPPGRLGLDLDTLHRADHDHGQVGHVEGGLEVGDEVGVAGGVEEVDLVALELEGGEGQRQGDATLHLLRVEVGGGGAVLHPALAADGAGAEQQGLGQARLARSTVADEGDVADLGRREALHGLLLLEGASLRLLTTSFRRVYRTCCYRRWARCSTSGAARVWSGACAP